MKIAVISDTHNQVPERLIRKLASADEIWHLGDVVSPDVLLPIESLGRPLYVVRGNCDYHGYWPETRQLERNGVTFQLQHLPPCRYLPNTEALLYGHLHQPFDDDELGMRCLNPGAISNPRNGSASSFAWLEFPIAGGWNWRIEKL